MRYISKLPAPSEPYRTISINPVGEPGCGKSTFSLWLCHALKVRGIKTEFVPEVVKYHTFNSEGIARVVSGKFDQRFLRLQQALILPLVGQVEVIVNDGALETFLHYAYSRVSPERLPLFISQLAKYRAQIASCEHRFVTVERAHPYDKTGRRQKEEEASGMRTKILYDLREDFGVTPLLLIGAAQKEAFVDGLCAEIIKNRSGNA
jgi:hypothetical protein